MKYFRAKKFMKFYITRYSPVAQVFTDNHWRDVLTSFQFHTIDIEIFGRMKDYAGYV